MQNTDDDDDDDSNKRTLSQFTVFHGLFSLSVHRYTKENHVSVSGDFSVEVSLSLVLQFWHLLVAVKTVWQCHGERTVLWWIWRGNVTLIYWGTHQYFILCNSETLTHAKTMGKLITSSVVKIWKFRNHCATKSRLFSIQIGHWHGHRGKGPAPYSGRDQNRWIFGIWGKEGSIRLRRKGLTRWSFLARQDFWAETKFCTRIFSRVSIQRIPVLFSIYSYMPPRPPSPETQIFILRRGDGAQHRPVPA